MGKGEGQAGEWGGVACSRAGSSSSVWDRLGALAAPTEAWIPQALGWQRGAHPRCSEQGFSSRLLPGPCASVRAWGGSPWQEDAQRCQ